MPTKMNDMTPSQVDNLLANAWYEIVVHETKVSNAGKSITVSKKNIKDWSPFLTVKAKAALPATNIAYWEKRIAEMTVRIEEAEAAIIASNLVLRSARDMQRSCEKEFRSRPWSRFWLVTNTGGHVHRNTSCRTCWPTTRYAFLPDYSGATDAELIEAGGSTICSTCFPDAPVDTWNRTGTIEAPDKKAAREEREKAKAEREAKKTAKAIANPDGTPIRLSGRWAEDVRTESRAQAIVMDFMSTELAIAAGKYAIRNTDYYEQKKTDHNMLLLALAHKRNQTVDELLLVLNKKAAAKYKRDWK